MSASLGDIGMRNPGRSTMIRKAVGGSRDVEEQLGTEETLPTEKLDIPPITASAVV